MSGFFFVGATTDADRFLAAVTEPPQSVRFESGGLLLPDGTVFPGVSLGSDETLYLMSDEDPQGCGTRYDESPPRSGIFVRPNRQSRTY